jgi:hypothetical protein
METELSVVVILHVTNILHKMTIAYTIDRGKDRNISPCGFLRYIDSNREEQLLIVLAFSCLNIQN